MSRTHSLLILDGGGGHAYPRCVLGTDGNSVDQFSRDVVEGGRYAYTDPNRLSSVLANRRMTEAIRALVTVDGKKVLDVGCGDGRYTLEVMEWGDPVSVQGVDPSGDAVRAAREQAAAAGDERLRFSVGRAEALEYQDRGMDLVILRGVLHHMALPLEGLREALRVGAEVVVVEPNGYNLGLKMLEKVSPYHRAHRERSFSPMLLRRWTREGGGQLTRDLYVGFVPVFCPRWLARVLKVLEPVIERLPGARKLLCAQYVFACRSRVSPVPQ